MRNLHADFYSDSVCTAIEGGIGYWSVCDAYRWEDRRPEDIYAEVHELDPHTGDSIGPALRIDWKTIRKGIQMILSGQVPIRRDLRAAISDAMAEKDAGYIDADAADCIVQAALLGELRYG